MKARLKPIEELVAEHKEDIYIDNANNILSCFGISKDGWDAMLDRDLEFYCVDTIGNLNIYQSDDIYPFWIPEWALDKQQYRKDNVNYEEGKT